MEAMKEWLQTASPDGEYCVWEWLHLYHCSCTDSCIISAMLQQSLLAPILCTSNFYFAWKRKWPNLWCPILQKPDTVLLFHYTEQHTILKMLKSAEEAQVKDVSSKSLVWWILHHFQLNYLSDHQRSDAAGSCQGSEKLAHICGW